MQKPTSVFDASIPIIYINRDEDESRRKYMESQFESLEIDWAVRFPAFTGDLLLADPGFRFDVTPVRRNVLRAVASHIWAIQSIDFKDSKYALVLEDDVVLSTCLNWDFSFKEFCQSLPEGWDSVQLYRNSKNETLYDFLNIHPYLPGYISTVAYLISKSRAEQVVKDWFRVGVPDLAKAHQANIGFLTDHVVYTPSSYSVNLFSTQDFESTIAEKIPAGFHASSREVIRLWEESPLTLSDLLTAPYTKTSPF